MPDQADIRNTISLPFIVRKVRERGVLWCAKRAFLRPALYLIALFQWAWHGLMIARLRRLNEYLHSGIDSRLTISNCPAWRCYPMFVRVVALLTGQPRKRDSEFVKHGFKQGLIPATLLELLREAVAKAPETQLIHEDYCPGYLHNDSLRERGLGEQVNRSHAFLRIESCSTEVIASLVRTLERPVTRCLGTNWRIFNVKCWRTSPGAAAVGMNAWHTDCMPLASLKIMLYATGASKTVGTTELELSDGSTKEIEGPAGTWLLFKNNEIRHRGIAPGCGSRTILELTIGPALLQQYRPVFAGTNAMYPFFPWFRSKVEPAAIHVGEVGRAA
jgi:hypothetical protein